MDAIRRRAIPSRTARRTRRAAARIGVGAVLVLGCLSMSACTPPPIDITAVVLDRGVPAVIFEPCDDMSVWKISASVETDGGGAWVVVDPEAKNPVGEVRLLETPDGWVQQITPSYRLEALQPGQEYLATAEASAGSIDVLSAMNA
jgi:hypothetical protein